MVLTKNRFAPLAGIGFALALSLAACQDESRFSSTRHLVPLSRKLVAQMDEKGMAKSDPILVRSFKKESEIEIWKRTKSGDYALLKSYPICRWSGQLGPKVREGDRQAPEGFYAINPAQMNPNSSYYLSFDTGPNAYDRANGRRFLPHGPWRLIARLLLHDGRADCRDLRAWPQGLCRRPAVVQFSPSVP
jgi:murein L,D-transpeptidase YafK